MICNKCHTKGNNERNICAWCGGELVSESKKIESHDPSAAENKLTATLIGSIPKLNYAAKVKLFRWMEDNVL